MEVGKGRKTWAAQAGFRKKARLAPRSSNAAAAGRKRVGLTLATRFFVFLDGLLKNPDDQGVKRRFVFFGPARQLFVQHRRHANLKVNHGFRHGSISPSKRGPKQESVCRVPAPPP